MLNIFCDSDDDLWMVNWEINSNGSRNFWHLADFRPCPGQPNGQNLQGEVTRNSMWFWMTRWARKVMLIWMDCPLLVGKTWWNTWLEIGTQHLLWMLFGTLTFQKLPIFQDILGALCDWWCDAPPGRMRSWVYGELLMWMPSLILAWFDVPTCFKQTLWPLDRFGDMMDPGIWGLFFIMIKIQKVVKSWLRSNTHYDSRNYVFCLNFDTKAIDGHPLYSASFILGLSHPKASKTEGY